MTAIIPMSTTSRWRFRFKVFLSLLGIILHYNRIQERLYLMRSALLLPHIVPWHHLMDHGDLSSFLFMTGLARVAFNTLQDITKPPGHPALGKQKGCKWSLSPDAQLGLLLFYIRNTMAIKHLCLLFGITPLACSQIVNNMLKLAVK
jgi:hypothetical protein